MLLLNRLVAGLSQPKAAAPFLVTGEKIRTLTAEEAFFGWLMAQPLEANSTLAAKSALEQLEALPETSEGLQKLIALFQQASLPIVRRRRSSLH